MKSYVLPEDIEKAKKIDLLTYFLNYAPNQIKQESRNQWCLKEHRSLKMSNGYWNWFSKGVGGKNAMDYFEKVLGIKYPESAKIVLDQMHIKTPVIVEHKKNKEENLILPERNTNENKVIRYLKQRGIDEEILQKCIDKKLIYEDKKYHNIVFVGYDENNIPRYAGRRATNNSNFKFDAIGSNKMYSFKLESIEKTDRIFIFEGAIDLLSYATLFKLYGQRWEDKTLISLAGVYQPAKILEQSKVPIAIDYYLKKHSEIKKIYLCLDNDQAGRSATTVLKTILGNQYEVIDMTPKKRKDYNEYLCELLSKSRNKKKKGKEKKNEIF